MPLDPQAKAFLDQATAAGGPQLHEMSVPDARQMIEMLSQMTSGTVETVAHVDDRTIPGPGGPIPVRVYRPEASGPLPALVYFHGGGWVIGSLASHDGICRILANAARCVVVSVDYRLAPEHKFPAAAEDAYAATRWVAEHGADLGADPRRIAVGGDSAGGNLTAVVSQLARDRGGPALRLQLLIYPATDAACDMPSMTENGQGYLLTFDGMRWFYGHYLRSAADVGNPMASPLRASDFRGLPPALVITAEYDPLRDEGEAYAGKLREAGVPTTLHRYDGMIHGFLPMVGVMDAAKQAVAEATAALRAALA